MSGGFSIEEELAVGDRFQSGNHAENGRFPAARGAQEDDEFARFDVETESVDGTGSSSVSLADTLQGNSASHMFRRGMWGAAGGLKIVEYSRAGNDMDAN